jgi:hypothetical protein
VGTDRRPRLLGALVALTLGVSAAPAAAKDVVASLGAGQSAFWAGGFATNERVPDAGLCSLAGRCFDYGLRVTSANADVLRVAVETSDDSNGWELRLLDPAGRQVADGSTYTNGGIAENFDVEVFAHHPAPGLWTVEVVPSNVVNGSFRVRAAVQGPVPVAKAKRKKKRKHRRRRHQHRAKAAAAVTDMPPDLAPDPPWHLTFEQPPPMVVVEGGNYTALLGIHNPTMQVAGQPIYDCLPEETIEQHAHRCLRFTSGFASLGPGPFEVYGSSPGPVALNGGPLYQVIYRSNGTTYSRPAGTFVFHHIHLHYHVVGIAQFTFFHVGPNHTLTPAGKVLKEGFCLGNIKIFDWRSFGQAEIDPNSRDSCAPKPQADGSWRFYEGMANGWEDAYKWQTSGQFVDFGNDPNGYYVLRMTVNPDGHLLESDYTDNVAYAYVQVTGNDVRMIERGHGTDPWDPHKIVEDPVITQ